MKFDKNIYSSKEWHSWITIIEGDYIDIGLDPVKKEKIKYLEINYLKKKENRPAKQKEGYKLFYSLHFVFR